MRWKGVAYRAHDPVWARLPLSGDGAARKGGRFNRVGLPTLYLALSVKGMLLEMGHGLDRRFSPLTICSYEVDVSDVVDLRTDAGRAQAGTTLEQMGCDWLEEQAAGRVPDSWRLGETLVAAGAAGVLTPSFATGARQRMDNLVLWKWGPELPHLVAVVDPEGRLPRNAASWAGG